VRHSTQLTGRSKAGLFALALLLFAVSVPSPAEVDPSQAEDVARNSFLQRFTKFTQDKNVMGKPRTATGQKTAGGKKTRFNQDDGLAYQSDLTYHDLSFNTIEQQQKGDNGKNNKVSRLFSFVSPHGGVSAAGGSSILERTTYQYHKQFTKQEEEEQQKKDDEQKGIKFRSIFKITTKDVANKDGNDKKAEPEKVERFELRDEVRPEIEKVGEDSFETIRKAGRDQESQDDPNALANGVLLRYAAGEATQAMWNSSLANLVQRRVNRGIRAGAFPDTPQVSEGVPTCAKWEATANQVLANVKGDQRKALQEEVTRMSQQCKQLAQLPYNVVDPRFEKNGKEEQLKIAGPQKEDGQVRDLRVQLEVLAKASKTADQVPSNWQYEGKDSKNKLTIDFDENGQPLAPREMTVTEQIESYNNQLREAAAGLAGVRSRIGLSGGGPTDGSAAVRIEYNDSAPKTGRGGGFDTQNLAGPAGGGSLEAAIPDEGQILSYQIDPNSKSVMEINQAPPQAFEEVGIQTKGPPPPSENYTELLQKSQQ